MLYFELNGFQYRTDGNTVEAKDGSKWNKTGSVSLVIYARELFKERNSHEDYDLD